MTDYDVIVIGGGPGGLSAGLWLARYRRRVLILDSGEPRNEPTWAVHGYPGIPDPPPHELRRILREQAETAGAIWQAGEVSTVEGEKDAFEVVTKDGRLTARRVLFSYGRQDVIPEIKGLQKLYGISVFHCPDCDGPSMLDQRVGVFGANRSAAILALYLLTWAKQVTVLTNGAKLDVTPEAAAVLEKYHIEIAPEEIAQLCADNGRLSAVEFRDGDALPLDGMFFHLGSHPASDLADQLGCSRDEDGNLNVDRTLESSVPGIYAAGDLSGGPYLTVTAAATGVRAALALHKSLLPADLEI